MARNDIPETIVSQGMKIEGELKSSGNIRIDGIVNGKVQTSLDLVIGTGAQIEADVVATNALIAGLVKGNVIVKNSLTITETGKILGNISCAQISIKEGGYFAGNCQMHEIKQTENKELGIMNKDPRS
jgi:cytoskeletal protein CcmA (bactofilin family)